MTKKSKMTLALASMLGITAGATAVSGFAWFTTTKSADLDITNIGVYSKSSALSVELTGTPVGCADSTTDPSDEGDINLVGAADTSLTYDTFTATAGQVDFELKAYPSALPTVSIKVGENAATAGTVDNWDKDSRTVTLTAAPGADAIVTISYYAYAALTDVSSADGQHIYKPTWTASGEGQYATAIPEASTGYIQFTMDLKATGSSPLKVYLNQPHIAAADANSDADTSAADITRVAFVEGTTTKLVLQNSIASPNNKGIDEAFVDPTNKTTHDGAQVYDISTLTATVDSVCGATVFAAPASGNKSTLSTAPAETAAMNYITTVAAGATTTITVSIWLEGTNGNDGNGPEGAFDVSPENGMINVQLPLIAF